LPSLPVLYTTIIKNKETKQKAYRPQQEAEMRVWGMSCQKQKQNLTLGVFRMHNTKTEHWVSMIMVCQGRLTDCHKCSPVLWGVDNEVGAKGK
jgi:hypothetical protein